MTELGECQHNCEEDNLVVHLNYAGITDGQLGNDQHIRPDLKDARYLYLKRNSITKLPCSIGQIAHLQEIHLEGNNITTLPTEIGELRCLQVLNVVSNYLTSLPATVGNLTALRKLQVSNNCIRQLPMEIGNLSELETLEASSNQLTAIPCDLVRCSKLKILALDKNKLQVFPRQLCWLKNLTELSLAANCLEYLPPLIFIKLTSLKNLILDNNPAILALPLRRGLRRDCIVGTNGLFQMDSAKSGRFRYKDGMFALPEEFHDCVSCFPCLQEIALRRVYKLCHSIEDIPSLPLPVNVKERLQYPSAYCINGNCRKRLFRCAIPNVISCGGTGKYYLTFCCSVWCMRQYMQSMQH